MNKRHSSLLSFLICTSSAAAVPSKWIQLAVDGPSSYYVDETSIVILGDHVEAYELADYPDDGSNWRSIRSRVRYNCTNGTAGVIASDFYSGPMGTGTIVESQIENAPYTVSLPGKPAFWLTAFVCSRASGMRPNKSFKPNPLRGSA